MSNTLVIQVNQYFNYPVHADAFAVPCEYDWNQFAIAICAKLQSETYDRVCLIGNPMADFRFTKAVVDLLRQIKADVVIDLICGAFEVAPAQMPETKALGVGVNVVIDSTCGIDVLGWIASLTPRRYNHVMNSIVTDSLNTQTVTTACAFKELYGKFPALIFSEFLSPSSAAANIAILSDVMMTMPYLIPVLVPTYGDRTTFIDLQGHITQTDDSGKYDLLKESVNTILLRIKALAERG